MARTAPRADGMTWTDPACPVARTLDLVGDRWSLLIVRDAMDGARAFTDFQQRTGIARNILTDRLRRLIERGILERQNAPTGRRQNYVLTEAGRDLFTVIVAARQWGERHAFAPTETHSLLVDGSGLPLPELRPTDAQRRPVDVDTTSVLHER
ncbi:helix-turn-helix domain-containing protein [Streptomyces sp. NE06-03E]|uniref:Helix-turn-helix domain-containing protein n=1 Tax=Streptomyces silvae TaxID=2803812 RepID=A0ABU8A916_9ACTN|nr:MULTISPECIES: helix-turn-helix domain-containing protein [unclassified Streptomyces]MDX3057947.1 helix-turn-helix domain-containing protein [Streptomyces sp. NE06-03E]MDX3327459.1 helix-turn-helix domain-containing protein [Streptomyces sp. ME02-6979-3A]MDX3434036.1 helix-turn-helix domain-containing protein [Streptomyces sp. ME01-18a]WSS64581.1 helix-turn-helix transcriptional regulator [Streptomyces sp. NBC_01177]